MKARQARSIIVTLLLLSAVSFTLANYAVPPTPQLLPKVQASALTITLSSATGVAGQVITLTTGATGTSPDGTACSLSGAPSNVVTNFQGEMFGSAAYGSFVVGTGPSNTGGTAYTLALTCGGDSGTKPFTVTPVMTFTPPAALPHTIITVTVTGLPSDTLGPCTITSSVNVQQVVFASPQSCTIPPGSGSATGTFDVNPGAADGGYTITVHYSTGSFSFSGASLFTKVPNPTVANAIAMSAAHAPPGWGTVSITGGGFVATGIAGAAQLRREAH